MFGSNNVNNVDKAFSSTPYTYSEQPAASPQRPYAYEQPGTVPMPQPYSPASGQAPQPGCLQGLVVPGAYGGTYDLNSIRLLSQAEFKFFVECSPYTRGDCAPMVKHCVNTALSWANRLDRDGKVEAYMIDGTQQAVVCVQRGEERVFSDRVVASQITHRPCVASALRSVALALQAKIGDNQPVAPHVLLFAVSGHHFDADDVIAALTNIKSNLKSMGHAHPENMFMVGFIKVGERGGLLDKSKNELRKMDNHKVVGRMVECDVDVTKNMEDRIFSMLQRFCHPETNGDSKLAGLAQSMFSKILK